MEGSIAFGELVKVTWLDAHGSAANATYEIDEIPHAPIKVVSYGVLLRDDEVGVSVASELCDTTCFRGYTFIPKGMVVKVEPLKKRRQKKLSTITTTGEIAK